MTNKYKQDKVEYRTERKVNEFYVAITEQHSSEWQTSRQFVEVGRTFFDHTSEGEYQNVVHAIKLEIKIPGTAKTLRDLAQMLLDTADDIES